MPSRLFFIASRGNFPFALKNNCVMSDLHVRDPACEQTIKEIEFSLQPPYCRLQGGNKLILGHTTFFSCASCRNIDESGGFPTVSFMYY